MIFWRFRFSKLKITFCGISLNFNSNQTISWNASAKESMYDTWCNLKMNFRSQILMRWVTHSSMFCLIWFYTDSLPLWLCLKESQTIAYSFINEAKNYTIKNF
jgi:hypothetical protein